MDSIAIENISQLSFASSFGAAYALAEPVAPELPFALVGIDNPAQSRVQLFVAELLTALVQRAQRIQLQDYGLPESLVRTCSLFLVLAIFICSCTALATFNFLWRCYVKPDLGVPL